MKAVSICLLAALAALMLPGGDALAAPRHDRGVQPVAVQDHAPASRSVLAQERARISLDQAAAMVREQTGGRIIKASTRNQNGRTVHHIRVLTRDGRVFTVRVDAATGRRL